MKAIGSTRLLALLLVTINGLVLFNTLVTDPRTGFDALDHLTYVRMLGGELRLPTSSDTTVFYSPPLPYMIPAGFYRLFSALEPLLAPLVDRLGLGNSEVRQGKTAAAYAEGKKLSVWQLVSLGAAGKIFHVMNFGISIAMTLLLVRICRLAQPGGGGFTELAIGFLGMLPLYYKSMTFIRGEPLAALFVLLAAYMLLLASRFGELTNKRAIPIGLVLGLGVLSKQWVFFFFPALVLFVAWRWWPRRRADLMKVALWLVLTVLTAAVVGGWYYVSLKLRYGKFTAYAAMVERSPLKTALARHGSGFWSDLRFRDLMTRPVRPAFDDRFLPTMYAETWGDYFGYFLTTKKDQPPRTVRYLGRVNVLALLPTAVMLFSVVLIMGLAGRAIVASRQPGAGDWQVLSGLLLLCFTLGFLWFEATSFDIRGLGGTIKPEYLLHALPFVAMACAEALVRLRRSSRLTFLVLVGALALIFFHNVPTMLSRYWWTLGAPHPRF